jgi:formylglycine-generating enzyme required for sulfatase activity
MLRIEDISLDVDIHKFNDLYQVELRHDDPSNQAELAPLRGEASFDPDELRKFESNPKAYGKELARQLFDKDKQLARRFMEVETAARLKGARLRLSLRIDGSAKELQALRWELLAHPTTEEFLTTSETLLMSRFMASSDWRSVQLGTKEELSALIVVSAPAPAKLERMKLAPVDFVAEKRTIERILAEHRVMVSVLGGPASPVTVEALIKSMRGTDIVYLVSHGTFSRKDGTAALVLQDEDGEAKVIKVDELTRRIRELERPPRLVVLASCQSAGDGDPLQLGQGSTLATRLAEAGVPAVVAMQGLISMKTVEAMMPTFFRELLRDGRIDRALAIARGEVRDHHDGWMPALFMRINDGRLWSDPPASESPERVEIRQPSGATSLESSGTIVPPARPGWPLVVGVLALVVSLILTLATLLSSLWGRPAPGQIAAGPMQAAASEPNRPDAPSSAPVGGPTTPPTSPPPAKLAFDLVEGGPSGRPWTSTSTGMRFIALEPAVFEMGSSTEEPGHTPGEQRHVVKLSQGFFIGDTEVTQGQWNKLMGSNPSLCEFGCGDELPVQNITWCDALRFLNELSKADGFAPAYAIPANCEQGGEVKWDTTVDAYRLPTEAEWEYAARAGTRTAYNFEPGGSSICAFANLGDQSASKKLSGHDFADCDDKFEYAAPVTAFEPNKWGLRGIHGNVWEWVWDRHGDYPKDPVVDPIGPSEGKDRCLRGGSFINEAIDIRSAKRHWDPPSWKLNRIGLRAVRGTGPS